jgi:putative transposase
VQGQLARRVRWGGCRNVRPVRGKARCVLTQSLQERRDAYRMAGRNITYYDQANQLPAIKDIREEYRDIHSQVLQDVLRKVDKAFKGYCSDLTSLIHSKHDRRRSDATAEGKPGTA